MKKLMTLLTAVVIATASFAQLSIGVQASGNLTSAKIKNENDFDYAKKMRVMPSIGLVAQYAVSNKFAIRSGINFQQSGVKLNANVEDNGGGNANMKVEALNTLNYLQVPVNFVYKAPVGGMQFFAGGGAYLNYGIGGKSLSTLTYTMPDGNEAKEEEKADPFKKEEDGGAGFKKTDVGLSALAGIRFSNGLFVNIGYQFGLTNIAKEANAVYKNRGLQLSIGYFLK